MFEKIEQVPEQIREFYQVETRREPTGEQQEVEYQTTDKKGDPVTATRMEPVFADVDYVVPATRGECRTIEDVWAVVRQHRGKRDDLVKRFLAMACNGNQWAFHDDYLAWYKAGLELEAVVLPEQEEGEPDPLIAHQDRIKQHEAQKPVKPALIDVQQWFLDNAVALRQAAYLPKEKQLEMMYDDMVNGTTLFPDHNRAVHEQYPKS